MDRLYPTRAQHWLLALILALCAGIGAAPAAQGAIPVQGFAAGSTCWFSGAAGLTYDRAAADPGQWTCSGEDVDWEQPRHIVRIDLRERGREAATLRFAEFDRHAFDQLTVTLIDKDGMATSRSYAFADTWLGKSSLHAMVELPQPIGTPATLVFTLDGSQWPEALIKADITAAPSVPPKAGLVHLYAALLCGFLLAPILFDLGYFRALRQPFPLWHALFCAMAFVQTASVSGLIPLMTPIGFDAELIITFFSLDVMVAAAFLFARYFLEPASLLPRQRKLLIGLALAALANGLATTFLPEFFGIWIDHIYFGAYLVILATYFWILRCARRAGSRMAMYLIFGLAPFAAIILLQFVGVIEVIDLSAFDETWPQNFALLFEVVATALAVADRFIEIKRERDEAVAEARSLELISERDVLTGLLNRRALKSRFEGLVADGFHTIAVLDLDHFKPINDLYGHPFGDRVLAAVGQALQSSAGDDQLSFRIGGEEFLLMLRGADTTERAERQREAIAACTMELMEDMDGPVTASMGVLDFAAVAGEPLIDFTSLYTRADKLLYDAKCAGRDQTRFERLELFQAEHIPVESAAA